MTPLEAALAISLAVFGLSALLARELERLEDPGYLGSQGVIIVAAGAIEAYAEPIGEYLGAPIWGSVAFKGMRYRFDRVIDPRRREKIGPGELYLDPGLVYARENPGNR